MTGIDIRAGDTVWISAVVLDTSGLIPDGLPGDQQLRVQLFGKSEDCKPWIRLSHVEQVVPSGFGIPGEPPDGEWLCTGGKAWRRDDVQAEEEHVPTSRGVAPRYPRRWWDFEYQEWLDWPTAYIRGARPDSSPFRTSAVGETDV